jgi:hypothetical protein
VVEVCRLCRMHPAKVSSIRAHTYDKSEVYTAGGTFALEQGLRELLRDGLNIGLEAKNVAEGPNFPILQVGKSEVFTPDARPPEEEVRRPTT